MIRRTLIIIITLATLTIYSQGSYESAYSRYTKGDITGAVSEITKDIFNGIRDPRSYLLIIKIYKENIKDYKQGVEYAIEGIRLFPEREKEFLLELGELYYLQQKYQSAEEILRTFNSKYPGNGKCLLLLGKVFYSQGKFYKAVASLEASISFGEKSLEAYEYLGKSLRKIGNYNKSLEVLSYVYNQTKKEEILGIIIEISSILDIDYNTYLSSKRIITSSQKTQPTPKSEQTRPKISDDNQTTPQQSTPTQPNSEVNQNNPETSENLKNTGGEE